MTGSWGHQNDIWINYFSINSSLPTTINHSNRNRFSFEMDYILCECFCCVGNTFLGNCFDSKHISKTSSSINQNNAFVNSEAFFLPTKSRLSITEQIPSWHSSVFQRILKSSTTYHGRAHFSCCHLFQQFVTELEK